MLSFFINDASNSHEHNTPDNNYLKDRMPTTNTQVAGTRACAEMLPSRVLPYEHRTGAAVHHLVETPHNSC